MVYSGGFWGRRYLAHRPFNNSFPILLLYIHVYIYIYILCLPNGIAFYVQHCTSWGLRFRSVSRLFDRDDAEKRTEMEFVPGVFGRRCFVQHLRLFCDEATVKWEGRDETGSKVFFVLLRLLNPNGFRKWKPSGFSVVVVVRWGALARQRGGK